MATRFWVGGTGTADLSSTAHWAATSNGAAGASVPGSGDTVTFDGSSGGGTVTINAAFSWISLTMGAFTGTLDFSANDNNITLQTFSGTGTGTRTLNMGDGTWTITGTGTVWNNLTVTNFTFNANGSTLKFTGTGVARRTYTPNSTLTYNNVTIEANPTGGSLLFNTVTTISGTLTVNGNSIVEFQQGSTTTVANLAINGTPTGVPILKSTVTDTTATISSSGTAAFQWAGIRDLTFSGGGSYIAKNSFDLGHNSGVTFTPPLGVQPTYGLGI